MRSDFPLPDAKSRRNGIALVIVLAFMVLLTGLIVAYFSRAMFSRKSSNNSASETKADMLARSATDQIVADLRQEIATGSTLTTYPASASATPYTVYVPTANAYMLPQRSGTPPPTGSPAVGPITNLVRRSVRTDPIAPPGVGSRASAVNSYADPTNDGRIVTPARWNSHYLIPRFDMGTAIDSTPDVSASFTPPDWVLMTRAGPAVETGIGSGATAINNLVSTNQNYVIGRYAYAIYDEGGLLDMNVAGHPATTAPPVPYSTPSTSSPPPYTTAQVARRGSLALADLTQLPVVKAPTIGTASNYLAQSQVDSIVGWRNFGSLNSPSGAFPAFTFSASNSASWFSNFIDANRRGYLSVFSAAASVTSTDQALLSRQQLIKLLLSANSAASNANGPYVQNALQYMGTFSRALEQPSFVPPHIQYPGSAPSINAVATSTPPPAGTTNSPDVDNYLGNNDYAGIQASSGLSYQDVYNPAFLTVRVKTPFSRQDGSLAVVGEPLLKKKFPLSRLAEMSYLATSSTQSITDPMATGNHILAWFGLARTSTSASWTYNHGQTYIMSLTEVAAANREPDFAELLKAAINIGSLAKGGPNLHADQGNYQYTIDTMVDYQVLQIMANLIDQSDDDSYPTAIQFYTGSIARTVRGVEDLPYFYRYHPMSVVTSTPSPLLSHASNQVRWHNIADAAPTPTPTPVPPGATPAPTPTPPPGFQTSYDVTPGSSLSNPGKAVYLYIPDVWNPNDASTVLTGNPALRPAHFRLAVTTADPTNAGTWNTGAISTIVGNWYDDIPPKSMIPASLAPLQDATTAFTFNDNHGVLFREPTLLWRADVPSGSGLAPDSSGSLAGPYMDAYTGVSYYGVQIGQTPISYVATVDPAKYYGADPSAFDQKTSISPSGSYVFQGGSLVPNQQLLPGAYAQYTFRLEYQDPSNSNNWIVYDEKYPDFHGLYPPNMIVNKTDFPNSIWMNPYSSNQINDSSTSYDPRTARFGVGTEANIGTSGTAFLEPGAAANATSNTDSGNMAFAGSNPSVMGTQRPGSDRGDGVNFSNPGMTSDPGKNTQMLWYGGVGFSATNGATTSPDFYNGLLSQNDQKQSLLARDNSTVTQIYYEDPDGIDRRAMAAYALQTGNLPSTYSGSVLQGYPEATANTYTNSGSYGVGTPTKQSVSRPLILNRPFRSVAEMGYTFRGTPWKQLDFFTPESADTALLDVFCVNEIPANGVVAGKVNLNTRQAPVLQAIVAGAARDELGNVYGAPSYYSQTASVSTVVPTLSANEAANVAAKLLSITTSTNVWQGPLTNVGDLVGHYVNSAGAGAGATDVNTVTANYYSGSANSSNSVQFTYAGLSGALDSTVYAATGAITNSSNYKSKRLRESAIRALADVGQTRVWNLMIDVVAQSGRYGPNATALPQFIVDGEKRYWIHVAIDRSTGSVIDEQIEVVTE